MYIYIYIYIHIQYINIKQIIIHIVSHTQSEPRPPQAHVLERLQNTSSAVAGFVFGMHHVLDDKTDKLYKNKYGKIMGNVCHFCKNHISKQKHLEAHEIG